MIIFIGNLIDQPTVQRLIGLMDRAKFIDGKETAGELAAKVKNNRQIDPDEQS